MAVISGADYRTIAVQYSNARTSQLEIQEFLFDSVYEIVLSNDVNQTVDLLNPFWNTYLWGTSANSSTQNLLNSVRAINAHVFKESSFTTIDAYLVSEGVTVPQIWADLSNTVGYTISPANVDP